MRSPAEGLLRWGGGRSNAVRMSPALEGAAIYVEPDDLRGLPVLYRRAKAVLLRTALP